MATRLAAAAATTTAGLLLLAGCTGGTSTPLSPTSVTVERPTDEATVTPSSERTPTPPPAGLVGTGVIEDDGDGRGTYERVRLVDDSPLYEYREEVVNLDSVEGLYSGGDIASAQRVVSAYAVEEGLDSIVVDSERSEEWLAQNIGRYAVDFRPEVEKAAAETSRGAAMGAIVDSDVDRRREDLGDYAVVYDGGSRIKSLDMTLDSVYAFESGALAFEYSGRVTRDLRTGDAGVTVVETNTFEQAYSVIREDGEWMLTGWQNDYDYTMAPP